MARERQLSMFAQEEKGFHLPVLTYHHVSDEINYYTCIRPLDFVLQMASVLEEFRPVGLDEAVNLYKQGLDLNGRFALTFDDGYRDNIRALNYLTERGVTTTLFIPTASIARDNRWNHKAPYIAPCLNEDEIRFLHTQGHQIGSHGKTHQILTKLSDCEVKEEVEGSKKVLSEIVEEEIAFFAYPFGMHDARVRGVVASFYQAAFATEKTAETLEWRDLFQLHRFSVGFDTPTFQIMEYLYACG